MEGIRTYLIPPSNLLFALMDLFHLLSPLVHLQFIEARPEDLHGRGPVFVLRAFVLALDHDPGGVMGDADGGIGFVHMLSASPAGPEGIYSEVGLVNINGHIIGSLRVYKYRRK